MKLVKVLFWLILSGGVSLGLLLGVTRSRDIIDWWKLREYVPAQNIELLADHAGFNKLGERLFYVNDPMLLDKSSFAEKCVVGEATIVLGCYVSAQNIYIFDVADSRLDGVEEVTAAHEMLHAAFDRLSPSKQDEIGELLIATFNTLESERIKKTIQTYEQRDNSVVVNELHSILATEVRVLPQALEDHYSQYFEDRLKVVAFAEMYAQEFERREADIAAYDAQLGTLQSEISRIEADVSSRAGVLTSEREALKSLSDDPESYNRAVGVYNAKVREYNNELSGLKSLVETYNTVVQERNGIALEERELVDAIDTRVDQL